MSTGSATQSSEIRVSLVGDDSHAETVRVLLRNDASLDVQPSGSESEPGQTDETDCLVCTSADSAETVCGRDETTPVVVALAAPDSEQTARAYRAGATSVVESSDRLPRQVAWVAGARGLVDDALDTSDVVDTASAFGDAVCVLDHRWRVRRSTAAFDELFDAPRSATDGLALWTVHSDPSPVERHCWEAVLTGTSQEFETGVGEDRRATVSVVPFDDGVALRYRDVTEVVETRESLDQYQRILETIDDGIYTLDDNFCITDVNEAVVEMTGYSREELVGSFATMLADESIIAEANTVIQDILTGAQDDGRLDVELQTADGDLIPVETRFSALQFADGTHGSVGVIRDISDRKRYERTLHALNSSAHELFAADTKYGVGDIVFDTATEILELDSVVVYLYDEGAGRLEPVACEGPTDLPTIGPGDGALWNCFVDGTSVSLDVSDPADCEWDALDSVDDISGVSEGSVAVPLGEHGLLATVSSPDGTRRGQTTLTNLLAANAEAALDRVSRSVELERRKEELSRRNEELTSLNRFNELLREVNRVLVEADTREAIEQAVCEQLVDGPSIAFAWIGALDRGEETMVPRAWAGSERGYLDCLSADPEEFSTEPSLVAAREGETTVVDNVGRHIQRHGWRRDALTREFASVASIPLTYHEFGYGVLTVYATEPDAFDEQTRLMFEELGVTTANAINGADAKESLHTESIIELDVSVTSPNSPLHRISQSVGGEIRLEGSVRQSSGAMLVYMTIVDAEMDADALASLTAVEDVRVIAERDEETLVEAQLSADTLPSRLADMGAAVKRLTSTEQSLDVSVELPPHSDVREFVETLQESYPGTELSAKRTSEKSAETSQSFRANVRDNLTSRQFEVLRTAYFSGYFQWPRDRTASELAESLGVSQPTFSRHLRVAEQKLLDDLLGE